jgi:hypothetical protein
LPKARKFWCVFFLVRHARMSTCVERAPNYAHVPKHGGKRYIDAGALCRHCPRISTWSI